MKVLKRKTRMISVRLSEDEYNSLFQLCERTGARSISDMARDALQMLIRAESENNDDRPGTRTRGMLVSKVMALDTRVSALDRTVEKLAQVFTAPGERR